MSGVSVVEQRRDVGGWLRRWHPEVAARAVANGDWPNRTVADFARERVAAHPQKIHIFDGERQLSCIALSQYRSEEHTSELESLMRISYAVFCLKNKKDAVLAWDSTTREPERTAALTSTMHIPYVKPTSYHTA